MNNHEYANQEPEVVIDFVTVFWDLLEQWKAVLIVALAAAVALSCFKLMRDTKAYHSAQEIEIEETPKNVAVDDAIDQALASLSDEDRPAVETLVDQQKLVDMQADYLSKSLILNTDLTNLSTLYLYYDLEADDGVEVQPLASAYAALLARDSSIRRLGDAIDPNADTRFIPELINVTISSAPDSGARDLTMIIGVVLPNEEDADAMRDALQSLVDDLKTELGTSRGNHALELFSTDKRDTYDYDMIARKQSIVNSISSNRAAIKTAAIALNANQQEAWKTITSAMGKSDDLVPVGTTAATSQAAATKTVKEAPAKPSLSTKFLVIGFVVGILLYVGGYVTIVALSRRVRSGNGLSAYTRTRLLSEVFLPVKHTGVSKLFHSRIISKYRYAKNGTVEEQVTDMISTVDSVCEHVSASELHVLCIGRDTCVTGQIVDSLVNKGIPTHLIDATSGLNEKELLHVRNVVWCVNTKEKASDVWRLTCLCHNYDVTQLGCVSICEY